MIIRTVPLVGTAGWCSILSGACHISLVVDIKAVCLLLQHCKRQVSERIRKPKEQHSKYTKQYTALEYSGAKRVCCHQLLESCA